MSRLSVSAPKLFLKQHLRVELAFKRYEIMIKSFRAFKETSAKVLELEGFIAKKIL